MTALRTPDDRFEGLSDYPFAPHYVDIDGMRMHYVDEGPADGEVVLLLHGEPSWSYLYRFMIPPLAERGYRVLAPDLFGFGKSDKPTSQEDYSYAGHVAWLHGFVRALDLRGITMFCQDWGSLLGLRIAAEDEARFARIAIGNGFLPTGDHEMPQAFLDWREFARTSPNFDIGRIIQRATVRELTDAEVAAYDAPFPSDDYKAGARAFPNLVPARPDDPASDANRAAWKVYAGWQKPFLTLFSDSDPVTRGGEKPFQKMVPGAKDQPHATIADAAHFLQEDKPLELVEHIDKLIKATPQG